MINNCISPIKDGYIEKYFKEKELNLRATLNYEDAFKDAEFVVISTPTNYDDEKNFFDISSVEDIIQKVIKMGINTTMVVKSTIPVGFIKSMKEKYHIDNILFSPEFLREGKALYDNLYQLRIVVDENSERAKKFVQLLYDLYEFTYFYTVFLMVLIMVLLIMSFVMIYVGNDNANNSYYQSTLGILNSIGILFDLLKIPHVNLSYSANMLKKWQSLLLLKH